MERPVLQPIRRLASSLPLTAKRTQATTGRTKKALKIRPHPSFINTTNQEHIVFNPPSSTPSVYHTPFKFLPRQDPRRQANLTHLVRANSTFSTSSAFELLPSVGTAVNGGFVPPKHHVTREQVEEMRRLRASDPADWSVLALAKKFGCSNYFVMMCCKAPVEHRAGEKARLEAIKARWGPIRTKAREERQKRNQLLAKDQL